MIHRLKKPENKRRILVFLGDLILMAALLLALIGIYAALARFGILHLARPLKVWGLIPAPLVLMVLGYIFELYDIAVKERLRTVLWVVSTCFLAFWIMFGLAKLLHINQTTMLAVLFYYTALAAGMSVWRLAARRVFLRRRAHIKSRVLLLGHDSVTVELIQSMRFHDFKIVGLLSLPGQNGSAPEGVTLLGSLDRLPSILQSDSIDLALTSLDANLPLPTMKLLYQSRYNGLEVHDSQYYYESLTGKVALTRHLRRETSPYLSLDAFVHPFFKNVKRLIDIAGALAGLTVLSPFLVAIMIVQKILTPGPVFFIQHRVGFQERPFALIKFRTMVPDAEKHTGPAWAAANDPRITPVGRRLRKLRLDELPQLINILRGDMSFVGPRPIRRHFAERIEEQMPFYSLRFSVKPGLTGWAQINCGYGDSLEGQIEKFQFDLYYIKHASVVLDLMILLKTLQTVVRRTGH
jgi:exopolysaccharide biosynthesis polyprenyl glycosylphosphotransferase